MKSAYGQYCPLALAAEVVCERWTLLIVSRVIDGCEQFNDIHRGVPRISPSLLSKRLDQLVRAGVLAKRPATNATRARYTLTQAGRDLEPLIGTLAVWGQRWGRDMIGDDLDPAFLLWSMHTRLAIAAMPPGRTVIEFEFSGAPKDCRRFWLVHERGIVDMCLKHPGYDVDLAVAADLRLFVEAWRGFRDLRSEIRARRVLVHGPSKLVRQFPDWLLLSSLATRPRMRAGRERRLASDNNRRRGTGQRVRQELLNGGERGIRTLDRAFDPILP